LVSVSCIVLFKMTGQEKKFNSIMLFLTKHIGYEFNRLVYKFICSAWSFIFSLLASVAPVEIRFSFVKRVKNFNLFTFSEDRLNRPSIPHSNSDLALRRICKN
jgi:hypothetical protein